MLDEERLLGGFVTDSCRGFVRHWLALPRQNYIPHSRDFLDRAPASHMPSVIVLELDSQGIVCRFMGSEVVNSWRHDLTGQRVDERAFAWGSKSGKNGLQSMIARPCGLYRTATITLATGRPVEYEAVQLPLGVDPGRPLRIVAYGRPIDLAVKQDRNYHARSGDSGVVHWFDVGAGVPQSPP
jgi:hypothetical protein